MKINPNAAAGTNGVQTSETKKADKTKISGYQSNESSSQAIKNESSKAEISSRAKDMAKAKQIASDTPDVREAKIAALKEQIKNKTYQVSSDAIADKLVDDHIRMSGA